MIVSYYGIIINSDNEVQDGKSGFFRPTRGIGRMDRTFASPNPAIFPLRKYSIYETRCLHGYRDRKNGFF